MRRIDMPKEVKIIIYVLEQRGFEAYAVGGCVRDAVIGRKPHDWDITTSALPEQIKKSFHKTIDTGIKHGTVTVMIEGKGFEVTTYRIDGKYEDGRHPNSVEFTSNLLEDLKRRDFTINAMAFNDRNGFIDEFDGLGDMDRHIVKCVGNPTDRFNEDALRILRAIRFAATLGYAIEKNTKQAISELAGNLEKVSKERIQAELDKIIMSNHIDRLKTAYELGVTKVVFPELDRLAECGELDNVIKLTQEIAVDHYLRWAAILSQLDRQKAEEVLRGFKFDNKTINIVSRLVGAIGRKLPASRADVRRDIYEIGEDIYWQYLRFMKVYLINGYLDNEELYEMELPGRVFDDSVRDYFLKLSIEAVHRMKRIHLYEFMLFQYRDILLQGECISLGTLAVNGRDMMELGAVRGAEVGEALNFLLYKVLEDSSLNDRETLMELYRKHREEAEI